MRIKKTSKLTRCLIGATVALSFCFPKSYSYAGMGWGQEQEAHKPRHILGGGNVEPPTAQPRHYSLFRMAATMANFFTTGSRTGVPPQTPFRVLYTSDTNPDHTFCVKTGDMLYVPILFVTDSPPPLGNFPDVNDRSALLNYFYSQQELGAVFTKIIVDGRETLLGSDYVVGVNFTDPLSDGGKNFITSAAFLTPFKKGLHTVEIAAQATGIAIGGVFEFSISYTVDVSEHGQCIN